MPHSDSLAHHIGRQTENLASVFDHILFCHVVTERVGRYRGNAKRYRVSIHLDLPGHYLSVVHGPPEHPGAATAQVATDRAFLEMSHKLETWVRRQRGSALDGTGTR